MNLTQPPWAQVSYRYYRITLVTKANSAGCAFLVNLTPNSPTSGLLGTEAVFESRIVRPLEMLLIEHKAKASSE